MKIQALARAALAVILTAFLVAITVGAILSISVAALNTPNASASGRALAPVQTANYPNQVLAANSITANVTSTARLLPTYSADCYEYTLLTGTQTVTIQIQHSADAANWQNLFAFDAVTHTGASQAATTAFTGTVAFYGTYMRAYATLASTPTVNLSVFCTFR